MEEVADEVVYTGYKQFHFINRFCKIESSLKFTF